MKSRTFACVALAILSIFYHSASARAAEAGPIGIDEANSNAVEKISPPPGMPEPTGPTATHSPALQAHVVYLQQNKDWRLVCDVEQEKPYLLIKGKREIANLTFRYFVDPTLPSPAGNGIMLRPTEFFVPAIIKVTKLGSRFGSMQVDRVQKLRKNILLHADFDPTAPLEKVFLAVEVISKSDNHRFFLHEIGLLEPHKPKSVSLDYVLAQGFEPASCQIHLFSNGVEVLNSEMPPADIALAVDQLVAFQLKNHPSTKPQPLIAPTPAYPAELKDKKTAGRAVVSFRITPEGNVEDARVTEANDPAFGTAALDALAQWRFVPAVQKGNPVATPASLPFAFSP